MSDLEQRIKEAAEKADDDDAEPGEIEAWYEIASPFNIKALLAEKDAEIKRLTRHLKRANDGLEEYERKFYLESDKVESLKAHAEQLEKVAEKYRKGHIFDEECVCSSGWDDRCSLCKAYDALSGPREGEQDGKAG